LLFFLTLAASSLAAHEGEKTRVILSLSADGSFILDVANDPMWLLLRLETFAGGSVPANLSAAERDARLAQLTSVFADRIVLFVDSHEVRASASSMCARNRLASRPGVVSSDRHDAARCDAAALAVRLGRRSLSARDPQPMDRRRSNGSRAPTGAT
jgi:hypothetical protein